ncbi:MAG: hypothetical protein WC967_13680 [Balneolaceae bacterium]
MKLLVKKTFLLIVAAGLFSIGCSLLNSKSETQIKLKTDQNSYIADTSSVIKLTVTNNTDNPVYFVCTGQIYLEELNGKNVEHSWMVHGFEKCLSRNPIEENKPVTFDISFNSIFLRDWFSTAQFDKNVDYRLRMDLYKTEEIDQLISEKNRVSNTFEIIQE